MKRILILLSLISTPCYAQTYVQVQPESEINIISIKSLPADKDNSVRTDLLFTINGTVIEIEQNIKSCNFKAGQTILTTNDKEVVVKPNSKCE